MIGNYAARQATHVLNKADVGVTEEIQNSKVFSGVTDQLVNEIVQDTEECQKKWQHNTQVYTGTTNGCQSGIRNTKGVEKFWRSEKFML
jgi:hypothetical protein